MNVFRFFRPFCRAVASLNERFSAFSHTQPGGASLHYQKWLNLVMARCSSTAA